MKIFGLRIIRDSEYQILVTLKKEITSILRKKLDLVSAAFLKKKNITFKKGVVLVNSQIMQSSIKHPLRTMINVLTECAIIGNVFTFTKFKKKK